MRKYLLLLCLFAETFHARTYGQELPAIQTDRPDQTECPFIVPARYFQMESGFSYAKEDASTDVYFYPAALMRYGVNANFELRLITEVSQVKTGSATFSGLLPLTAGFKVKLSEAKGIIPTTAFIGHITFPKIASEDFKISYYAPAFRFTMQHVLSDKFSFSYNLGARWTGEDAEPVFLYTVTTGYTISEKLGCYIELFGFAPQHSKSWHMFDGGFTYLLKDNIQLDISGGYQATDNAPDYYTALGVSFRIPG